MLRMQVIGSGANEYSSELILAYCCILVLKVRDERCTGVDPQSYIPNGEKRLFQAYGRSSLTYEQRRLMQGLERSTMMASGTA